jgi:hypothetical protein
MPGIVAACRCASAAGVFFARDFGFLLWASAWLLDEALLLACAMARWSGATTGTLFRASGALLMPGMPRIEVEESRAAREESIGIVIGIVMGMGIARPGACVSIPGIACPGMPRIVVS